MIELRAAHDVSGRLVETQFRLRDFGDHCDREQALTVGFYVPPDLAAAVLAAIENSSSLSSNQTPTQ